MSKMVNSVAQRTNRFRESLELAYSGISQWWGGVEHAAESRFSSTSWVEMFLNCYYNRRQLDHYYSRR